MVEAFHEDLRNTIRVSPHTAYRHYEEIHSYSDMWKMIRHFNHAIGGRSRCRIATLCAKSFKTYCAIFATILTGNTWVPLSPLTPPDRTVRMLEIAEPTVLIVHGSIDPIIASHARKLGIEVIDIADPDTLLGSLDLASVDVRPDDFAMIYFTSGTTGMPKGVPVTQDSLALNVANILSLVAIGQKEVFADYHDLSFVISVPILFPCAMMQGAISPAVHERDQLMPVAHMVRNQVSTLITVPSTIVRILKILRGTKLPDLNVLISCGEPLHLDVLESSLNTLCPRNMYNFYGSTEVGPWTFHHPCSLSDIERFREFGYLPIGKPIEGNEIRLTDEDELVVAGRQVSPGYLMGVGAGQFVEENDKRWYYTGDKVSLYQDVYICKGRLDSQVKVSGQRVELLDVESHLRYLDGVEGAVCLTRGSDETRHIVAILLSSRDFSTTEVRDHLAKHLPSYMLPRRVYCVRNFPTNRSGKVDRMVLKEQVDATMDETDGRNSTG
jgi:D-alanine--poly(phosphoribitol) ligase subunit 1